MRFPLHITTDMVGYQIKKSVGGQTRYPFVLMLEPLYTCNLACVGCSTERHTGKLSDRLPVETCLADGCHIVMVIDDGGRDSLIKSKGIQVSYQLANGQKIVLPIDLAGFGDALAQLKS